ncbi:MAG: AzlC family ABC transporter permease [Ruminococcus callidus]
MNKAFRKGVLQGIPIALGYLSVSFGFGILAVRAGLSIPAAVAISVTNVTSAGQAAGVGVIAAGGSYLEMALTQLTINFRYALMGFFPVPETGRKVSPAPAHDNGVRHH